jgi:hypothetical protein
MKPSELGRRLGIGVRVAGKIAQDRVHNAAQSPPRQASSEIAAQVRGAQDDMRQQTQAMVGKATRSAGRGIGGFLRPFSRVGGILFLEVTGVFFGLFALWFSVDMWKARQGYSQGPDHQHFLIDCVLVALFGYLCLSSFWRAQRK